MNVEEIAEHLTRVGYIVLDNPLQKPLTNLLFARCQDDDPLRFKPAQIGRGSNKKRISPLRGDVISWLDDSNSTDRAYLAWMETLRCGLNSTLFLGLFDYECHYAIYLAGAAYAKHSDVLQGARNRVVSTVFYLNEDWKTGDGGELRLFEPNGETAIATVAPSFGTMIIFLSESFPHEVLMAHNKRRSITGWFRVREG